MQVETLGIARSLGWKVHMRCAHGPREGLKRVRECVYRKQLDIDTLVCTRGPNFPLSRQAIRMAKTLAATEPHCGAIAFSRTGDPALGDFEDAVVLKTVGEVDEGFLKS